MKKGAVALTVVIVLGVAYAGSSWYVGKEAQKVIEQVVSQDNEEFLKILGTDFSEGTPKLTIENYDRGVFSSDVTYSLQFKAPDGAPAVVKLSDHLDHGPFPASRLKAGDFGPVMAVSRAKLVATPFTQKWFDSLADKGASPISALTAIGFSGTGHSVWEIKPLTITEDGGTAVFSGGTINVDLANDYRDKTVAGRFDSLNVTDETGKLAINGIRIDSKTTATDDGSVSHATAAADSLVIDQNGRLPLAVDGWSLDLDGTQAGNMLDGSLLYKFGAIKLGDADMGTLQLGVKAAHVDMAALAALNAEYHRQQDQDAKSRTAETVRNNAQALADKLQAVLASNPVLSIDPVQWKTDKGESTLLVKVQLSKPDGDMLPGNAQVLLSRSVKDIVADISLSKPLMEQFIGQMMLANGEAPPDGFVHSEVEGYGSRMVRSGLAKAQGDNLVSHIHFHDGAVDVNDATMTVSEFLQRLITLAMQY